MNELAYVLLGGFFFHCAWQLHRRCPASAGFWLVLGVLFALGGVLPARLCGILLLVLVGLDAGGRIRPLPRSQPLPPAGSRVVLPVLTIGLVLVGTALIAPRLGLDSTSTAILGLTLGSLSGAAAALLLTGDRFSQLLRSGCELNQTIGTVSLLPQILASLGAVLVAARLGPTLAAQLSPWAGSGVWGATLVTCLCMTALAALTGNSFAAYPVVSTGVLVPLLLARTQADPSALAMWTLSVGACGTLVTPMAANFNLVPAALLDLKDRYAVIKAQWPFALAIWLFHLVLMGGYAAAG